MLPSMLYLLYIQQVALYTMYQKSQSLHKQSQLIFLMVYYWHQQVSEDH